MLSEVSSAPPEGSLSCLEAVSASDGGLSWTEVGLPPVSRRGLSGLGALPASREGDLSRAALAGREDDEDVASPWVPPDRGLRWSDLGWEPGLGLELGLDRPEPGVRWCKSLWSW